MHGDQERTENVPVEPLRHGLSKKWFASGRTEIATAADDEEERLPEALVALGQIFVPMKNCIEQLGGFGAR